MFKFRKLAWLTLFVLMFSFLAPTAAKADSVDTTFSLTGKSGSNSGKYLGNLIISHPTMVICSGQPGQTGACTYSISARVGNSAVLPLMVDVVTAGGFVLSTFTIYSMSGTYNISAAPTANTNAYYAVSGASSYASGERITINSTALQVLGTPPGFSLTTNYGSLTDQSNTRTFTVNSKILFAQVGTPVRMHTSTSCINIPVFAAPVDYVTGQAASQNQRKDIDLEIYAIDPKQVASQTSYLTEAKGTWSNSGTTTSLEFSVCGIDPTRGQENLVVIYVRAIFRGQGTAYSTTAINEVIVSGTAPARQIACARGTSAIIVSSATPSCPKGYSQANIPIVNGSLRTTTISCIKGLTIRKVSAVIPSCPTGYRRK